MKGDKIKYQVLETINGFTRTIKTFENIQEAVKYFNNQTNLDENEKDFDNIYIKPVIE